MCILFNIKKDRSQYPGELLEQRVQDADHHSKLAPENPCTKCSGMGFRPHALTRRKCLDVIKGVSYQVLLALARWRCVGCDTTIRNYPSFMLPYKQYLLQAVTHHTETYLGEPEATYEESRCSNHVPLVRAGAVAEPGSTEEEKELEKICHLAPSTVYRWISWLDESLDAIEHSYLLSAASDVGHTLSPWLMASPKRCRPKRKKTLIRAAQALSLLKSKMPFTNLAIARPPP
jgi:hypothetical protein